MGEVAPRQIQMRKSPAALNSMRKFHRIFLSFYFLFTTGVVVTFFPHSYVDDPYITYRYAAHLAAGKGFVYNPGERILSTTTPLFVILLAGLSFIWNDIPHLANILGAIGLAAGAIALYALSLTWKSPWAGVVCLLLYPLFPLLVATLGFETSLYLAFCLAALLAYAKDRHTLAALCSALATLARPDGVLLGGILFTLYLFGSSRKPLTEFSVVYTATTLPWFVFAWVYFGSPIPTTLAAKQGQGAMAISERFAPGLLTVLNPYTHHWWFWGLMALALLGLINILIKNRKWLLLLSWEILYFLAYSILGVSRYFWYYAPLVPGLIATAGMGIETMTGIVFQRLNKKIAKSLIVQGLALGMIMALLAGELNSTYIFWSRVDRRYQMYKDVGLWLKDHVSEDANIGALEVGIIGYYSQRKMVDFAGLLEPALSGLFAPSTTYDELAVWVWKNIQPEIVIVHTHFLPELARSLDASPCGKEIHFEGQRYGYGSDIDIYHCFSY